MKSNLLFIALLFLGTMLSAQIFTEVRESDLINSTHGTVIFGDVNGDGAPDALFSGYDFFDSPAEITLYINDGAGNFTEKTNTPIQGVRSGSMAFADVDGNQTQDLLISGGRYWNNGGVIYITKLYLNGGSGNFTEKPIPGLSSIQGNFAFADVDGNNTQDVIISDFSETRLYLNDGNGNFTEKPDTASVFITSGDLAFADIDGNSTQDLIISGNDSLGLATYIYLNDGAGNFSIKSAMQNIGSSGGSITLADVDGDSTQDMLLSGIIFTTQVEKITRLYLNDGSGNFTEKTGTNFNTVSDG
ncbi:MAG: VCBS repeat-containing protein, partial [Bacteroidetes bacterium]|nr:VCBS repeat-containing protein [Bacteroidota bacterium]